VPAPNVRFVAIGDSATRGPSDRDYPDILRERLGQPADSFANEGHGGETTDEGIERLRLLIRWEIYPNAHTLLYWQGGADIIDFAGDVDPLLLLDPDSGLYPFKDGLNDKLDEIQRNIEDAIETAQSTGWLVYAATYYAAREEIGPCESLFLDTILPSQARHANAYIRRVNERIRLAVADTGAILVDVAAMTDVLQGDELYYFDCNHLSAEGNEIVANLFHDVIISR
jgi:lysophospholipase L1-like esterase